MLLGSETLINIKFTFQVEIAWQILETYIFRATEAVKKNYNQILLNISQNTRVFRR